MPQKWGRWYRPHQSWLFEWSARGGLEICLQVYQWRRRRNKTILTRLWGDTANCFLALLILWQRKAEKKNNNKKLGDPVIILMVNHLQRPAVNYESCECKTSTRSMGFQCTEIHEACFHCLLEIISMIIGASKSSLYLSVSTRGVIGQFSGPHFAVRPAHFN